MADYVQSIPTPDGELFFKAENSPSDHHYTASEFAAAFKESKQFKRILDRLDNGPGPNKWVAKLDSTTKHDEEASSMRQKEVPKQFKILYQNSFARSLGLNFKRHLTLWIRDKGFIIGMYERCGRLGTTGIACSKSC